MGTAPTSGFSPLSDKSGIRAFRALTDLLQSMNESELSFKINVSFMEVFDFNILF